MKKIAAAWNSVSLILKIVIGMIIGAILGLTLPQLTGLSILGTLFVGALKAIAPVLVFVLVVSALTQARSGIGRQFRTVVVLYLLNTFLAAVMAVVFAFLFPVTLRLTDAADQAAPGGVIEVLTTLLNNCVANPVAALTNANYLGILVWAILFGLGLKIIASDGTKRALGDISNAVSQVVRWVIGCAPFGILGLVFTAVSENGLSIFIDYGKLVAVLVGCMAVMSLVIIPIIVFACIRQNPYPLVLTCMRESGITAFFTRSSAANIPVNMSLCEKLGLDKDLYSVSIPLGATINMNGAAITITILSLAAAHTLGIEVSIPAAIILSLLATVSACGASGVAGGSLLLIPLACSLFGISNDIAMQVVGVGFIIGVIQDSCETAINSCGDVIFAATAEYYHKRKNGEKIEIKKVR
ncbi:MAG: serine/threonine transporter SstT [Anaerovoracaceae bacterium]|nr:serine/threonine transporter SstT [Bacillota bacterium]MDY5905655.1 serine/threonine transporter SstT [Anaerovoracaceae bacterium]